MNKQQFDNLTEFQPNELYAVETDNNFVTIDTNQDISGEKNFIQTNDMTYTRIKCNDLEQSVVPPSTIFNHFEFCDKNMMRLGVLEICRSSDGAAKTAVCATGTDGVQAIFEIYRHNGQSWATAPASNRNNSVLTTVGSNKNLNGYYKLGNGLIIQWGYYTSTSAGTITLPTPFTSTNYSVAISLTGGTSNNEYMKYLNTSEYTTTSFKTESSGKTGARKWIAIGY